MAMAASTTPRPEVHKRRRRANPTMDGYVVEGTKGHRYNDKTELQRLYYSTIDSVLGEMDQRFSERNSQLAKSLAALNPESDPFLDAKAVKHIMDLSGSPTCNAPHKKGPAGSTAFERDLTRKCTTEWKNTILLRFSTSTRRLQLF
ncbi:hypothetical protein JOQ06_002993 [Pogonophryne albipinna]|uniref:Uncharacterized protein n=1 Tax=Pogonophryne albipinna TaxID=1090488 RepID=A0AAD6B7W2_9TELE|nr:hypothetical protein JOQ06_002993 [Pogonophryne albipinna]